MNQTTQVRPDQTQSAETSDRTAQLEALQQQIRDAMHIQDPQERQSTLNILGARIEDLVKKAEEDQVTFAERVRSLDDSLASIDLEVSSYEKFTPEEQQWINDADKAREEAKSAWIFKDKKIKAAEEAFKAATQRAETAREKRLQSAKLGSSLHRYIVAATATRDQADVRRTSASTQEGILQEQLTLSEGELRDVTTNIEKYRSEVEDLERQKADASEELNSTDAGTNARRESEERIRTIEGQLDLATAERDKALAESDALVKFIDATTGSLKAQRKLGRNLDIIIQVIETGLNKRVALIEARLDTMKSMETLKVARDVVQVGDEVDAANAEYAAQAANAADEFVTGYLEEQPNRIEQMRQILADQEKNAQEMSRRVNELWKKYDADYEAA